MKKFVKSYEDYGIIIPPNSISEDIYTVCPICTPTRKSEHQHEKKLGVKLAEGYWNCSHCGWKSHLLTEEYQKNMKFRVLSRRVSSDLSQAIIKWFREERKISELTLRLCRVTTEYHSIRQDKTENEKERGKLIEKLCIAFNYFYKGLLVDVKYRDRLKNFALIKDASLIFYGMDDIVGKEEATIVEGEIDKLAFYEAGIKECVSVPNGVAISAKEKEHFEKTGQFFPGKAMNMEYLDVCIDDLLDKKIIYIGTDNDPAGNKLMFELVRRFGTHKCKKLNFGKYKDANDVLINEGPEALYKIKDNAENFPVEDIITVDDVAQELDHEFDHGKEKGIPTGWQTINPHFNWRSGDLVIGSGYPGQGKTTGTFNLLLATTWLYNWKWCMFTPENYPEKRVYDMLTEILIGNSSDVDIVGRMPKSQYREALSFIKKHFFLVSTKRRWSPKDMRDKKKEMLERFGINGFLTDPWNALRNKYTDISAYLENELSEEVNFATQNRLINLINAHPPTPVRDKTKVYPAPSSFEIVGGQIWSAKAYALICWHRQDTKDWYNTNTELHIQKTKDHKLIGIPTYSDPIILKLERRSNRFTEEINGKDICPFDNVIEKLFNKQTDLEGF